MRIAHLSTVPNRREVAPHTHQAKKRQTHIRSFPSCEFPPNALMMTVFKVNRSILMTPLKIPYGLADFQRLRREGFFYQDRTDRIGQLEAAGHQLIFLRPRRLGNSLLLKILENYTTSTRPIRSAIWRSATIRDCRTTRRPVNGYGSIGRSRIPGTGVYARPAATLS